MISLIITIITLRPSKDLCRFVRIDLYPSPHKRSRYSVFHRYTRFGATLDDVELRHEGQAAVGLRKLMSLKSF